MRILRPLGLFLAVEKTCRKDRKCFKCGRIIPSGNTLIAIQNPVVYRNYQDIGWCCLKHGVPSREEVNDEWIWRKYNV